MPRINFNEVENYNTTGSDFFQLKNDKDTEVVHILADGMDDIDVLVLHKINIDGKDRYVNCLRNHNDPIDYCPLCASGFKPIVRAFIQLYSLKDGVVKIWDRGVSILKQLDSHARRLSPLYATPFEIERNGKAGDQKTTYTFFPIINDQNYPEADLDSLPEKVEIVGVEKTLVLDKTYEELEEYASGNEVKPLQRRSASTPTTQAPQSRATAPQPRLGARRTRNY